MARRALVTGASSGIGLATALDLARTGFAVTGTVRSDEGEGALRRAAASRGLEVAVERLELTDGDARAEVVDRVRPWALVNNAGYVNMGLVEDVDLPSARLQVEAMVVGPVDLAVRAARHMRARGEGRIVNVTSVSGHADAPLFGWYQAAKHALVALSDALRTELGADGIDVAMVAPGPYATPIWPRARRELEARKASSSRPAAYDRGVALLDHAGRHLGDPQVVARAITGALTCGRPRPVHRVGPWAPALELADALVPARRKDDLAQRLLDLRRPPGA